MEWNIAKTRGLVRVTKKLGPAGPKLQNIWKRMRASNRSMDVKNQVFGVHTSLIAKKMINVPLLLLQSNVLQFKCKSLSYTTVILSSTSCHFTL